jgi:hypothetical protein
MGVLKEGRVPGGRAYGYRAVAGAPGRFAIEQAEAEVVRRIFRAYVAGENPRAIAAALNADGIGGPRGGKWRSSAIGGSRARQTGILQNTLYAGIITWDRQRYLKHPVTGRRVSRPKPEFEWKTAPAPALRIVDDKMFAAAQARKLSRSQEIERYTRAPKHLLSGLIKCGVCGAPMIVAGHDKRGRVLRCSSAVEGQGCGNRRSIAVTMIEARVLEGIEKHLLAPELVAIYVREFHRAFTEQSAKERGRRAELERRLPRLAAECEATADELLKFRSSTLRARLAKLEQERAVIEAELADLKALLDGHGEASRAEAFAKLRMLVEKIVIHPSGPYKPVDIEIHGALAALLRDEGTVSESAVVLVAGIGRDRFSELPRLTVTIRSKYKPRGK